MIEMPKVSNKQLRAQCVGVTSEAIQDVLKVAERNQELDGYSEARAQRIRVYREVLTDRLLGITK